MHMLLSAAVAILALGQEFISATPVGSSTLVTRVLPESEYAKIEDFTVDRFTKDMTSQPEKDKCLFYTRRTATGQTESLSKTAQCYAKENGLTTIWRHWPKTPGKHYYDLTEKNFLYRIMQDEEKQRNYFENMSEAYARACKGRIYVMTDDPDKLPENGIWHTTEYPTLKSMKKVIDEIIAISLDGKVSVKIWPEDGTCRSDSDSDGALKLSTELKDCEEADHSEPEGKDFFG